MSAIDCERLLSEVGSGANGPCGPAPDGDPLFDELRSASRPKPESMIASVENGADRTNWHDIQRKAVDLLSRTKDLDTTVTLCQALLRLEGFAGFADGLRTLHGLLDRYWDSVHPRLSEEDQSDPLIRISRVAALKDPTMLRAVRDAELAAASVLGRVTLRDVQIASGQLVAPENDSAPKTAEQIDAVFAAADLARLKSNADAVDESLKLVGQMEALFAIRSNNARRLDVDDLKALLGNAQTLLRGWIERRSVVAAGSPDGEFAVGAIDATPGAGAGRPIGAITSRQDAVRALDAIGSYFDQHEPSSPVSLLVQRARRLVSKSFIEIMRDVAPGGLPEAQRILGVKDEQSS